MKELAGILQHEQFQEIATAVQALPQRVVMWEHCTNIKSLLSSLSEVRGRVQTISGEVAAELGGGDTSVKDTTAAMKEA